MAGAYIFGYLLGRGFILVLVVLFLLYQATLAILEALANAYINYRSRHPQTPASKRRNNRIFWITYVSVIVFCGAYTYLNSIIHFYK